MCFAIGSQHLWCRNLQLKYVSNQAYLIKKFKPHCMYAFAKAAAPCARVGPRTWTTMPRAGVFDLRSLSVASYPTARTCTILIVGLRSLSVVSYPTARTCTILIVGLRFLSVVSYPTARPHAMPVTCVHCLWCRTQQQGPVRS